MATFPAICDIVTLRDNSIGTIKFIGEVKDKFGIWYGIELAQPNGTSDGSWNGIAYFQTNAQCAAFVQRREIARIIPNNDPRFSNLQRQQIGDEIRVKSLRCSGIIRFIGSTHFKPNVLFYGLQLTQPLGDNNGIVAGHQYFLCSPQYGKFIEIASLSKHGGTTKKKKRKSVKGKKKKSKSKQHAQTKQESYVSYDEFIQTYEAQTHSIKQNMASFYKEKFLDFFEMFSDHVNLPKEVMDLIIRYIESSMDTKSHLLKYGGGFVGYTRM